MKVRNLKPNISSEPCVLQLLSRLVKKRFWAKVVKRHVIGWCMWHIDDIAMPDTLLIHKWLQYIKWYHTIQAEPVAETQCWLFEPDFWTLKSLYRLGSQSEIVEFSEHQQIFRLWTTQTSSCCTRSSKIKSHLTQGVGGLTWAQQLQLGTSSTYPRPRVFLAAKQ